MAGSAGLLPASLPRRILAAWASAAVKAPDTRACETRFGGFSFGRLWPTAVLSCLCGKPECNTQASVRSQHGAVLKRLLMQGVRALRSRRFASGRSRQRRDIPRQSYPGMKSLCSDIPANGWRRQKQTPVSMWRTVNGFYNYEQRRASSERNRLQLIRNFFLARNVLITHNPPSIRKRKCPC